MKPIQFQNKQSQRVYDDYVKRMKHATKSLDSTAQDDVLMEYNSHIYESMQSVPDTQELDTLLDVLERMGNPAEVLKPLVADRHLDRATRTFNPLHVLKAVLLNLGNGISYIIFFVLYLFLGSFIFLIGAKIFKPQQVGMFFDAEGFRVLGMHPMTTDEAVREVLGAWFIPMMLIAAVVFYFIITLLMRAKRMANRA